MNKIRKFFVFGVLLALVLMIVSCSPKACPEDARVCPDGTSVARNPDLNCEFNPCPEVKEEMAQIEVVPATTNANNGDTISVDVKVSDVEDFFGFQFNVAYNPEVLEFVDAQEGAFINGNGEDSTYCVGYDVSSPGLVKNLVCIRLGSGSIDGSGVIETLTFKAVGSGESMVELVDVKLAKPDTGRIEHKVANGKVVVG